mgnify:CR=1 FL=1
MTPASSDQPVRLRAGADEPSGEDEWEALRLEALARSMLDGLAVWMRELRRPPNERSPTTTARFRSCKAPAVISEADARVEHQAADYQAFKDAHAQRGAEMADYFADALHSLKGLPHVIDIRNIGLKIPGYGTLSAY